MMKVVSFASARCLPSQIITHEAASGLMSRNTSWKRWPCIPREVKVETHKWVNSELEKQHIPWVQEDILDWRMSRALPDAARTARKFPSRADVIGSLLMSREQSKSRFIVSKQ